MEFFRPNGVLAGFHADHPGARVPELIHVGEQWMPMQREIGLHEHATWEFYFQIDGVSLWRSGRKDYELKAGDFFAAPPLVPHELVTRGTGSHHFFFAAVDLNSVFRRHAALRPAWQRRDCIRVQGAEGVAAPFRLLVHEVTLQQAHRDRGIRTALDYLVIEATRAVAEPGARALVPLHPGVIQVKNLLEQQPDQGWKIAELAKLAHLSETRLSELFKEQVGVSPHQFLLRQRIERAKALLSDSEASVTDVAVELGFSSSQHFAKMFRKLVGTSARAYRQRRKS